MRRIYKRAVVVLWLCLLGLSAAYLLVYGPPLRTDISQFLPQSESSDHSILLEQLRQGTAVRLIMLSIGGADRQVLAEASQSMRKALSQNTSFSRVDNGASPLSEGEVELLRRYRYLLTDQHYDTASLHQALQQRLRELSYALNLSLKSTLPADPSQALSTYLRGLAGTHRPNMDYGVWFDAGRQRALLLLEVKGAAMDLQVQQQAREAIYAAWQLVDGYQGMRLAISGAGPIALQSRDLIRSEVNRLSWLASVGVMLVLLLAYRSPRLLVVAALPLGSGILAAAVTVDLLLGELHGITLAFGITLLGVAVDYPIHLIGHASRDGDTRGALKTIGPILRLSIISTSLGFSTLLLSGFPGLTQLGLFAIVGLLSAAAVTVWVVPVLQPKAPRLSIKAQTLRPRVPRIIGWLPLLASLLAAAWLWGAGGNIWQDDPAQLSPVSNASRDLDRQMRAELGAPDIRYIVTVAGADRQSVLQRCEALAPSLDRAVSEKLIDAYASPAGYLPSVEKQRARQAAIPTAEAMGKHLADALEGLPFRAGLFQPFLDALQQSRALPPLKPGDLRGTLPELRVQNTLLDTPNGYVGIILLNDVSRPGALAQMLDSQHDDQQLRDLRGETHALMSHYRAETLRLLLWGIAAMAVVLGLSLRRGAEVVRVLVPVLAALVTTSGLLIGFGETLNLFHLCAMMLVLGLGIDYALFFRHAAATPQGYETYKGLILCNITTLMVFGLLAAASIPVLHAIGSTVAIGAALSLIFAFVMTHNRRPS